MPARTRILNQIIQEAIECEIPGPEFQAILRFMPGANIQLLKHSLKELKGYARRPNPADLLPRLHRVYHRKLAEQSGLYAVFHILESAYRSRLAIWMEAHYGTQTWWEPVLQRLRDRDRYGSSATMDRINGVPISNGAVRAMENMLKNVEGERLDRGILSGASGYEVLSHAKLSDIEELIHEQWAGFKSQLHDTLKNGKPLDQGIFRGKFKRVRDARNVAYHHREVAQRTDIISTAEELLDFIDVHLGSAVENVVHAGIRMPTFLVSCEERHRLLFTDFPVFHVETTHEARDVKFHDVTAVSGGDALAKKLATFSGDDRSRLTSLRIILEPPPVH